MGMSSKLKMVKSSITQLRIVLSCSGILLLSRPRDLSREWLVGWAALFATFSSYNSGQNYLEIIYTVIKD